MGISGLLKALRTKEPKESKSSSNSSASSESIQKTNSIVTKQIVTKQISTATHLGDIRHIVANKTAVIDGYSWLHKAIFGCAKLVGKEAWVDRQGSCPAPFAEYVLRRLKMLKHHNITPVVIFDGAKIDAKAGTHSVRRKKRDAHLKNGREILKQANQAYRKNKKGFQVQSLYSQAEKQLQLGVSVSHEMVTHTIRMMKKQGYQFIVAPYEADAQLAMEIKSGRAQLIISEDSDNLTYLAAAGLWGDTMPPLITKLTEPEGDCTIIDLSDLVGQAADKTPKSFLGKLKDFCPQVEEKGARVTVGARGFIQMCVLAGCDYAPSVKGVGIVTAQTLVLGKSREDPNKRLERIVTLSMGRKKAGKVKHVVREGYYKEARLAELTFLHHQVYNEGKCVHLTPLVKEDIIEAEQSRTNGTSADGEQMYSDLLLKLGDTFTDEVVESIKNGRQNPNKLGNYIEEPKMMVTPAMFNSKHTSAAVASSSSSSSSSSSFASSSFSSSSFSSSSSTSSTSSASSSSNNIGVSGFNISTSKPSTTAFAPLPSVSYSPGGSLVEGPPASASSVSSSYASSNNDFSNASSNKKLGASITCFNSTSQTKSKTKSIVDNFIVPAPIIKTDVQVKIDPTLAEFQLEQTPSGSRQPCHEQSTNMHAMLSKPAKREIISKNMNSSSSSSSSSGYTSQGNNNSSSSGARKRKKTSNPFIKATPKATLSYISTPSTSLQSVINSKAMPTKEIKVIKVDGGVGNTGSSGIKRNSASVRMAKRQQASKKPKKKNTKKNGKKNGKQKGIVGFFTRKP